MHENQGVIGTRLGPYDIQEEVGHGGMATVYRAHHGPTDRTVALKVMKSFFADDPDTLARFQREARLIAKLEHPHLLPVYDFDGTHDPPYIVMRYLESGTLKDTSSAASVFPSRPPCTSWARWPRLWTTPTGRG